MDNLDKAAIIKNFRIATQMLIDLDQECDCETINDLITDISNVNIYLLTTYLSLASGE